MGRTVTGGPVGLLIGGDRITSTADTHEHIFPATGLPNATVALAGVADVDRAVVPHARPSGSGRRKPSMSVATG